MKNKKTLTELKAEYKKKREIVLALDRRIERLENEQKIPELKKKYEGKYFVYNNSCSPQQQWPMYVHCIRVVDFNFCICSTFETAPDSCAFTVNKRMHYHNCQRQISKKVYDAALRKFKRQLEKI